MELNEDPRLLGFLSGFTVWLLSGDARWLGGAVCIGLVIPFTLIGIMPTNRRLLTPGRDLTSSDTRALLAKWGKLHAVRSVLSFIASVVYLGLLV